MQINQRPMPSIEHPIDIIEAIASTRHWPFERGTEDEMNLCIAGGCSDYQLAINWRADLGGLHAASIFEIRIMRDKFAAMYELIGRINEQLWLGHFDIWANDGTILFRNTMMIGGSGLSPTQCDEFIAHAVAACERFFPAFQFVLWAGKSPAEALEACLFETRGDA